MFSDATSLVGVCRQTILRHDIMRLDMRPMCIKPKKSFQHLQQAQINAQDPSPKSATKLYWDPTSLSHHTVSQHCFVCLSLDHFGSFLAAMCDVTLRCPNVNKTSVHVHCHEFHETCHSVTFHFVTKGDFLILGGSVLYQI